MYTSTEVHGVQGSGRFLFCTHWLNPLDMAIQFFLNQSLLKKSNCQKISDH